MPTFKGTFVQATYVLVTIFHIINISAISAPTRLISIESQPKKIVVVVVVVIGVVVVVVHVVVVVVHVVVVVIPVVDPRNIP